MAPAVGIDLVTTYFCVSAYQHDRAEIIPNDKGDRKTPSFVAFGDERLVGNSAMIQRRRMYNSKLRSILGRSACRGKERRIRSNQRKW